MKSVRRWVHTLSILLLLFAQQAALAHAVWHQRAASTTQDLDVDKASLQMGECDLHGVFAQVLGGACVNASDVSVPRLPNSNSAATFQPRIKPDLPAHRSRGPPVLT
jgi:hypothetical protein